MSINRGIQFVVLMVLVTIAGINILVMGGCGEDSPYGGVLHQVDTNAHDDAEVDVDNIDTGKQSDVSGETGDLGHDDDITDVGADSSNCEGGEDASDGGDVAIPLPTEGEGAVEGAAEGEGTETEGTLQSEGLAEGEGAPDPEEGQPSEGEVIAEGEGQENPDPTLCESDDDCTPLYGNVCAEGQCRTCDSVRYVEGTNINLGCTEEVPTCQATEAVTQEGAHRQIFVCAPATPFARLHISIDESADGVTEGRSLPENARNERVLRVTMTAEGAAINLSSARSIFIGDFTPKDIDLTQSQVFIPEMGGSGFINQVEGIVLFPDETTVEVGRDFHAELRVSTTTATQRNNFQGCFLEFQAVTKLRQGAVQVIWEGVGENAVEQLCGPEMTFESPLPDTDQDDLPDINDNCPQIWNPGQEDFDHDGRGDACDNCVGVSNPSQGDHDRNGIGDDCQQKATLYTLQDSSLFDSHLQPGVPDQVIDRAYLYTDGGDVEITTLLATLGGEFSPQDIDFEGTYAHLTVTWLSGTFPTINVPIPRNGRIFFPEGGWLVPANDNVMIEIYMSPSDPKVANSFYNCFAEFGATDKGTGRQVEVTYVYGEEAERCGPWMELDPSHRSPNDRDQDAVPDNLDNCPNVWNIDQADDDRDGLGNECDHYITPILQVLPVTEYVSPSPTRYGEMQRRATFEVSAFYHDLPMAGATLAFEGELPEVIADYSWWSSGVQLLFSNGGEWMVGQGARQYLDAYVFIPWRLEGPPARLRACIIRVTTNDLGDQTYDAPRIFLADKNQDEGGKVCGPWFEVQ